MTGPQFFTRIVKKELRRVQAGEYSPLCQNLFVENTIVIFISNFREGGIKVFAQHPAGQTLVSTTGVVDSFYATG